MILRIEHTAAMGRTIWVWTAGWRWNLRQNTDRILVSHAGNLPRPANLNALAAGGQEIDAATGAAYLAQLPQAVQDIVDVQIELGVDIVNDGEYAKAGNSMTPTSSGSH